MEIEQKQINDFSILVLNGRLDTTNFHVFEKELNNVVGTGQNKIVVDCANMDYISSSGLRIFLLFLN